MMRRWISLLACMMIVAPAWAQEEELPADLESLQSMKAGADQELKDVEAKLNAKCKGFEASADAAELKTAWQAAETDYRSFVDKDATLVEARNAINAARAAVEKAKREAANQDDAGVAINQEREDITAKEPLLDFDARLADFQLKEKVSKAIMRSASAFVRTG